MSWSGSRAVVAANIHSAFRQGRRLTACEGCPRYLDWYGIRDIKQFRSLAECYAAAMMAAPVGQGGSTRQPVNLLTAHTRLQKPLASSSAQTVDGLVHQHQQQLPVSSQRRKIRPDHRMPTDTQGSKGLPRLHAAETQRSPGRQASTRQQSQVLRLALLRQAHCGSTATGHRMTARMPNSPYPQKPLRRTRCGMHKAGSLNAGPQHACMHRLLVVLQHSRTHMFQAYHLVHPRGSQGKCSSTALNATVQAQNYVSPRNPFVHCKRQQYSRSTVIWYDCTLSHTSPPGPSVRCQ